MIEAQGSRRIFGLLRQYAPLPPRRGENSRLWASRFALCQISHSDLTVVWALSCTRQQAFSRRLEDEMASQRMTALLAMLAMAGWQNRDKLGELLAMAAGQRPTGPSAGANPGVGSPSTAAGGLGGLLGGCLAVAVAVKQCRVD